MSGQTNVFWSNCHFQISYCITLLLFLFCCCNFVTFREVKIWGKDYQGSVLWVITSRNSKSHIFNLAKKAHIPLYLLIRFNIVKKNFNKRLIIKISEIECWQNIVRIPNSESVLKMEIQLTAREFRSLNIYVDTWTV